MTAIRIATEEQARTAAHEALDAGHIEAAIEIVSALRDHTWPQEAAESTTGGNNQCLT